MPIVMFLSLLFTQPDCTECKLLKKGWAFYQSHEYDSAIQYFEKSILLSELNKNEKYLAFGFINLGNAYASVGQRKEAAENHIKAANAFRLLKITDQEYHSWNNAAQNLNNIGNYHSALSCLDEASVLAQQLGAEYVFSNHLAIGRIHEELLDLDKAKAQFDLALAIAQKQNSCQMISKVSIDLGNVYLLKIELDSAKALFEFAYNQSLKSRDSVELAMAANNLGEVALRNGEFEEAEKLLSESLAIKEKVNPNKLPTTQFRLGEIYAIQGKYDQAEQMLDEALMAGQKTGDLEILFGTYNVLSKYYQAIEDFPKALNALRTIDSLKTERFNKQRLAAARFQADQELNKTMEELDAQIQLNKTQRRINYITVGGILLFFVASVIFFFQYQANLKLRKRVELLLKEQNHRVKNNLQMIGSLLSLQSQKLLSTDAKDVLEASQSRINSVALLNRMLYEGDQLGEIDVQEYLKSLLEEIRFTSPRATHLQLKTDENIMIPPERATSLGLVINELVTNSVKHVEPEIALEISIEIRQEENKISTKYQDNGSGVDPEKWQQSSSFGNQLIRLQIDQMRGEFEFLNSSGFCMLFSIPATS